VPPVEDKAVGIAFIRADDVAGNARAAALQYLLDVIAVNQALDGSRRVDDIVTKLGAL
jgi:hypothetical protein